LDKAEHARKGIHQNLSNLFATHAAAPEDEQGDSSVLDGGTLCSTMSNAAVFADDNPTLCSDSLKPEVIGSIGGKVVVMRFCDGPPFLERSNHLFFAETAIDEERGGS
jgi:hypothetical protein